MEVFLDKMESIIDKFYKSECNYEILNSELSKIKKDLSSGVEEVKSLNDKIHKLEILIESLKLKNNTSENFWSGIIDFIVKLIYVFVVSYILYVMGWESPPV
jgi:hypothetical protein